MAPWQGYADQALLKAEAKTLIWVEPLPDGGHAVVKMYRRRGFLDPARHWFVPYRVEREYRLLVHLHGSGIPCAEPLRWSHGRDRRHGHHEVLVTRRIPAAEPLRDRLRDNPAAAPDLAPLFAIARRMHDCGVAHGAFYAPNILVDVTASSPARFYVIDMAHGCRFARGIAGTPPADYDVLDMIRSLERVIPIDDCPRWVEAYGLGPEGSERLLTQLEHHRLERPWRHIRRAETDAREVMDRLRHPVAAATR